MLLAAGLCLAPQAARADPVSLFDLGLSGVVDLRLGLADGAESWRHGGTGALRFGGDHGDLTPHAAIGDAHLIWQPQAGAIRVHVDARLQPGAGQDFGLNEGWIAWHPQPSGDTHVSARAGLFYPPASLENDGPGWTATRTITPSAINSWIGEEVKPVAGEFTVQRALGSGTIAATAAIFAVNDTAGTEIAFRGWALHDGMTVAGERLPLPPLSPFAASVQPAFTTPVYELDGHVGWYGKLEWTPSPKLSLSAFWYDNHGDRVTLDEDFQWAWQTRFLDLGLRYAPDDRTEILAQGLAGSGKMGFHRADQLWFDIDFQSAYLLVSRGIGHGTLTGRIDVFRVGDRTLQSIDDNGEHGWALTAAYTRPLATWATLTMEALHVGSDRPGRLYAGVPAAGRSSQLQAALRCYF